MYYPYLQGMDAVTTTGDPVHADGVGLVVIAPMVGHVEHPPGPTSVMTAVAWQPVF